MKPTIPLLFLLLAGCATGEKATDLQPGMSKEQVKRALGQPDGYSSEGTREQFKYTNQLISGWSWDRADYYATFENGRLIAWGSQDVRQNRPPVSTLMVYPIQPIQ